MRKGYTRAFHMWHFSHMRNVTICLFLLFALRTPSTFAASKPTGGYRDLDNDSSQWEIFHDQGYTLGTIFSSSKPSIDGQALRVHLLPGWSYAGIHAFRDLPSADAAMSFSADYSFFFPTLTAIQALEFTMNKWKNNQRWEWALQWQVVPDGTSQQGRPYSWRLWDGHNWDNIERQQTLQAGAWHTLHLTGNIVNSQVHYLGFICDGLSAHLQSQSFAPVSSPGDKLAIAMQLDGNTIEAPYIVYFDQVNLQWQ